MCPSYQATMDEEHSPRGRSRLLFEMLDGHGDSTIKDGWRSEAVRDASISAWPVKGARATARSTSTSRPTRRSSSPTTTRAGSDRGRTTRSVGCRQHRSVAATCTSSGSRTCFPKYPILSRLATRAAGLAPREIPAFAGESLQQWWVTTQRAASQVPRHGHALGGHLHESVPSRDRQSGHRGARARRVGGRAPSRPICAAGSPGSRPVS